MEHQPAVSPKESGERLLDILASLCGEREQEKMRASLEEMIGAGQEIGRSFELRYFAGVEERRLLLQRAAEAQGHFLYLLMKEGKDDPQLRLETQQHMAVATGMSPSVRPADGWTYRTSVPSLRDLRRDIRSTAGEEETFAIAIGLALSEVLWGQGQSDPVQACRYNMAGEHLFQAVGFLMEHIEDPKRDFG